MIKPDGVQRSKMGKIIQKFEQKGFKLLAIKLVQPGIEQFEKHYEEHKGKQMFHRITQWSTKGPVLAMVWQGKGVIV